MAQVYCNDDDGSERVVTINNYTDLFALDYLYSLVWSVEIGQDGIPNESPLVSTTLVWFDRQQYQCDPVTAAMILEEIAGFRQHS
jgi:hypothetical protein